MRSLKDQNKLKDLKYSFEVVSSINGVTKQVKYEVKPIEKSEEIEGTTKLMHIYVKDERYKSHDQQFNAPQYNPHDP